jgi:tRNA(His) 5'-end guanylyltransferase
MSDSLGDRIKRYEMVTRHYGTKKVPMMIRVDGKAFHTLTRGCDKPFDQKLINSMVESAVVVAENMQGFKLGYVQSDEATFLLTDYDDVKTSAWFDYNLNKLNSITAAMMTAAFNKSYDTPIDAMALFDARAFNVPKEDVVNAFLWRAKDWERNSLQMFARSVFSHKQLHKKNRADMHDMLHQEGKNWATDLTPQQKNGTILYNDGDGVKGEYSVKATYDEMSAFMNGFIGVE